MYTEHYKMFETYPVHENIYYVITYLNSELLTLSLYSYNLSKEKYFLCMK